MAGKESNAAPQPALDELISSFDLERAAPDRFRGTAPAGSRTRIFGGVVLGQAITAAARHLDRSDLVLRSLHCDFLRSGLPGEPVDISVATTSDGRTFAARRLEMHQGDTLLLNVLARFHDVGEGPRHHVTAPLPLPDPQSLSDFASRLEPHKEKAPDWASGNLPIDVRFTADPDANGQVTWFRAAGTLGPDPTTHACVAAYASDMTLLGAATLPFGLEWWAPGVALASLDHAMWFHAGFRADEWTVFEQRIVSSGAGRALVTGSMFTADGQLVATIVQDGLFKLA